MSVKPLRDATWAAEALGCSRLRVYELVRQNLIPHVRLGRSIKFDPAAVEHFIHEGGCPLAGESPQGSVDVQCGANG